MKVYKNKWFNRFCKNQKITDTRLLKMVDEIKSGKIDVDYGGSVIKQRLSRSNKGKSGGYRNIILYKSGENVFLFMGMQKMIEIT